MPLLCLLNKEASQLPQVGECLQDGLGIQAADDALAPLKDAVEVKISSMRGMVPWILRIRLLRRLALGLSQQPVPDSPPGAGGSLVHPFFSHYCMESSPEASSPRSYRAGDLQLRIWHLTQTQSSRELSGHGTVQTYIEVINHKPQQTALNKMPGLALNILLTRTSILCFTVSNKT